MTGEGEALRRWQGPARVVGWLFLLVAATAVAVNARHPFQMDFVSYWSAAWLASDGQALAAYNIAVHRAVEARVVAFDGLMPFPYPPAYLILLLPLAWLPYPAAAGVWIALTLAGYALAARRLMPEAGWLAVAFPPVLINMVIGQNGLLTAALFIGGLALLPRRPFLAGLLMGCLVVKPHLGLLLPLAFVAGREWRAFAGATLSSVGLLLIGLVAFGPASHAAWIAQMPLYGSIVSEGLVGWHKMASVYAALRLAGLPAYAAWVMHGIVALAAAALVWRVWRAEAGFGARGAALAAATALISPYLYAYDIVLLVVPFVWLARDRSLQPLLALLWLVLLANVAQNWGWNGAVNLTPLVPILLLVLVARRLQRGGEGRGGAAAPGRPRLVG